MLELLRGLSELSKCLTAGIDKMEDHILNPPTLTPDFRTMNITVTAALCQGLPQLDLQTTDNANYRVSHQPLHSSYQAIPPIDWVEGERPLSMIAQPLPSDA